jgi:integrase
LSDPFVYVRKHLPKRAKNHPEVFRFDEWMNVIRRIDPFYRPVAETMIMSGLIGSEIAGLRRGDIQGEKMIIQNSVVREHEKADLTEDEVALLESIGGTFKKKKVKPKKKPKPKTKAKPKKSTGKKKPAKKSGKKRSR